MLDVDMSHNQTSTAEEEGLQATNSTGVHQSDAVQASRQMLLQPSANTMDLQPPPPPPPPPRPPMATANRFTAAALATPGNSLRPAETPQDMTALPVLSSVVAGRNLNRRDLPLVCHVIDCGISLANHADYYQRYRICKDHLRCPAMIVEGFPQRFCQQCGRFHDLNAFDNDRRNCRARLAQHNSRRRKYGITNGAEEKAAPAPGEVQQSARRRATAVEYAKYDDTEYDLDYDELRRRHQRARTGAALDVSGGAHHGGELGDGDVGLLDQLVAAATGIEAATLEREEETHTAPVRLQSRPQDGVYHQNHNHHHQQQHQRPNDSNRHMNRNHLSRDDSIISGYFGTSTIPQAYENGRGGGTPPAASMFGGSAATGNRGGEYPPNANANANITGGDGRDGGGGGSMHPSRPPPSSSMPAAGTAASAPAIASILSELEHLLGRRMLMQMMQHAGGGGGGGYAGGLQQQQQQHGYPQPFSPSFDVGGSVQVLELLRMLSGNGSGVLPSPSMQHYNSTTSTQSGLQLNSMASHQYSVPHPAMQQQQQYQQQQQLQSFQPTPTSTTTSVHMLDALSQLAAMRGGGMQPEQSPFVSQFPRVNSNNNINVNTAAAAPPPPPPQPHPSVHRPTPTPFANNLPNALPYEIMEKLAAAAKASPSPVVPPTQPLPVSAPWQSAVYPVQQHIGSNGRGIHTSNGGAPPPAPSVTAPATGTSVSSSAAMQRLLEMLQSSQQVTQGQPQLKYEHTGKGGISQDGSNAAAIAAAPTAAPMTTTLTDNFTQQLMALLQQSGAGLVQPPASLPAAAVAAADGTTAPAAAPTTTASHDEIKTKSDDNPQDA